MKLRIHHFFDIIRDFGSGKKINPHPFGHVYHKIAEEIRNNPDLEFELVMAADDICAPCSHLISRVCDDVIAHRNDFNRKEDFNNHLDGQIMKLGGFEFEKTYTPKLIFAQAEKYVENIQEIYSGNDFEHTEIRKQNVLHGLKYYSEKHGFY